MQIWLGKNGCHRNLMKANGLLSEIRHRRRWQQTEPGQSLIEGLFFVLSIHYWAVYPVDKRIRFNL